MKIRMTFKTPDAVFYTLRECGLDEESEEYTALSNLLSRFIKHGEYLTVEFDTENGTCTTVKV